MRPRTTRRGFLGRLASGALVLPVSAGRVRGMWTSSSHPDPGPGIDASQVLSAELRRSQGFGDDVIEVFDMVRRIPQIADGLASHCGCGLLGNRRAIDARWAT